MGDMVDFVLVQADALHEIDLDLIARGEAAHQLGAREAAMLRDRENGRNIVTGMRAIGGEECVVKIQLAHGYSVRPSSPFRRDTPIGGITIDCRSRFVRMCAGLVASAYNGSTRDRSRGDRCVVYDSIADHLDD